MGRPLPPGAPERLCWSSGRDCSRGTYLLQVITGSTIPRRVGPAVAEEVVDEAIRDAGSRRPYELS